MLEHALYIYMICLDVLSIKLIRVMSNMLQTVAGW